MSYTYYENWRRESLKRLNEAKESLESIRSLMEKSGVDEIEIERKIEVISQLISHSEGLHKRYKYPDALEKSREARDLLKELRYLVLASKE
jgi:hypothetical protein